MLDHVGSCWIILYTLAHMMSIWSIWSYYIHPKTSTMVHMSFGNGHHPFMVTLGMVVGIYGIVLPTPHKTRSKIPDLTRHRKKPWHLTALFLSATADAGPIEKLGVQQRDQHPVFSDLLGCGTVRMMANWLVVVYVYKNNINC